MIDSHDGMTVCDTKKKWFNEQHTDRVGTQLYMSPEQVNNIPIMYMIILVNYQFIN